MRGPLLVCNSHHKDGPRGPQERAIAVHCYAGGIAHFPASHGCLRAVEIVITACIGQMGGASRCDVVGIVTQICSARHAYVRQLYINHLPRTWHARHDGPQPRPTPHTYIYHNPTVWCVGQRARSFICSPFYEIEQATGATSYSPNGAPLAAVEDFQTSFVWGCPSDQPQLVINCSDGPVSSFTKEFRPYRSLRSCMLVPM